MPPNLAHQNPTYSGIYLEGLTDAQFKFRPSATTNEGAWAAAETQVLA